MENTIQSSCFDIIRKKINNIDKKALIQLIMLANIDRPIIINDVNNNKKRRKKYDLKLSNKYCLTVEEASSYFNIGENKIRELISDENCKFVIYNGRKAMIKRALFEKFINENNLI